MKGNSIFIICLGITLLIGIAGFLYNEGYLIPPNQKSKENQLVMTKDQTSSTPDRIDILKIADINESMIGKKVSVNGKISNRYDHKDGHVFLTLEENNGSLKVVIFSDMEISTEHLQEGETVNVKGELKEYNDELEINVESISDEVLENTQIPEITKSNIGDKINVTAVIVSKYSHPEGHIFLNVQLESGQEITVPIFNNLNPLSDNFPVFSTIKVDGEVNEYNSKLQIVPNGIESIHVIEKGDEAQIKEIDLKNITEQDRGRMVIVSGFVKGIQPRDDGHLMFYLVDKNSKIKTVLFRADTEEIKGRKERIVHAEKAQFSVKLVGMVDIYEGELEIVVDKVLVD
ncbi:exodeoxyribonuclease VII large subunit [Litchfieldia alkalitelluris]|uniref:exodeoxyribonuclease VII large subunit n=1 Tax=Litchfieldia alkalitelluris TaxID=304268 RepID=UPI0014757DCC|nr:exodeoxyribonuclease VII large subunit [Litchfieldia alkalitelluris]